MLSLQSTPQSNLRANQSTARSKFSMRERDQLMPLVVEGPSHLRSLRLRQLKSIERHLVAAQAEQAKLPLELHHN